MNFFIFVQIFFSISADTAEKEKKMQIFFSFFSFSVAILKQMWYNVSITKKERYTPMSDFNFFEHSVAEKAEGKRRTVKILGRVGLLAVILAFVIVCFATFPPLAILAMVLLPVILTLWKKFNCDFKYVIEGAAITFYYVYFASKKPKEILKVVIKDFHEIAPRTAESDAKIKAEGYNKVYMFASSTGAADQYYATFEQNGEKCVVYFEAVEKSLSLLRYYNKNTIVTVVSK